MTVGVWGVEGYYRDMLQGARPGQGHNPRYGSSGPVSDAKCINIQH